MVGELWIKKAQIQFSVGVGTIKIEGPNLSTVRKKTNPDFNRKQTRPNQFFVSNKDQL